jgi:hypothetical protein
MCAHIYTGVWGAQIRDRILALHAANAEVRLQTRDAKDLQSDLLHMEVRALSHALCSAPIPFSPDPSPLDGGRRRCDNPRTRR